MEQDKLYELIDNIPITPENALIIEQIKKDLERKRLYSCFRKN